MAEKKEKKPDAIDKRTTWLLAAFSVTIAFGTALLMLSSVVFEESEPTPVTSYLVEFYGRECIHCLNMMPIISQLESELNVTFSKVEVWHNSGNRALFQQFSEQVEDACGGVGVPTFYNNQTKSFLCGEVDKQALSDFASGKQEGRVQ